MVFHHNLRSVLLGRVQSLSRILSISIHNFSSNLALTPLVRFRCQQTCKSCSHSVPG